MDSLLKIEKDYKEGVADDNAEGIYCFRDET